MLEIRASRQNFMLQVFKRSIGVEAYKQSKKEIAGNYPQKGKFRGLGNVGDGILQFSLPFCSEIVAQAGKKETLFGKKNLPVLTAMLLDVGFSIGTLVLFYSMNVDAAVPTAIRMGYNFIAGALNESYQRRTKK